MKLVRDLERRLEQLVEGVAGKVFRGAVHPAELGARIVRESDLARREGPFGAIAPNQFAVHLNDKDISALVDPDAVNRELEHVVEATATSRGWRLEGPARVWLEADPAVSAGMIRVDAAEVPGERDPWAQLISADEELPLTRNRCLVGRAAEADVSLPIDSVSRRHALVWQEAEAAWIFDVGSANGTFVDGRPVIEPTQIETGHRISFGASPYTFRIV